MQTWKTFLLMALVASAGYLQAAEDVTSPPTTEEMKELSATYGNLFGRSVKQMDFDINIEAFMQGFKDGMAGKPAPLSDQQFQQRMMLLQAQAAQATAEKNLKEAEAYLKDNATKSGVKELEPGKLQYTILSQGSGAAVAEHGKPEINYTGKYIDGTVFGSSEESGGPISISLDQTIPGFSEGLLGMREGEKRRLFIHPDLGYGAQGQLVPNSLLIFDIELVKASANDDDEASENGEELDDNDE